MGWDGSAAAAAVDDVAVFDIMSNVKSPGGVQRGTGNGLAKVKTANHLCESQQALLLCVGYYDYADDNSFKCVLISLPFSLKSLSPAAGGPPPLPAALIWKVLLLLFSAIRTSSSRWMASDIQQNSFGRMRFLFLSPLPIDFLSLLLQLQLCEHVQDRHAELQHRLSTSKHTDSHGNFRFGSRIIPPFIQ